MAGGPVGRQDNSAGRLRHCRLPCPAVRLQRCAHPLQVSLRRGALLSLRGHAPFLLVYGLLWTSLAAGEFRCWVTFRKLGNVCLETRTAVRAVCGFKTSITAIVWGCRFSDLNLPPKNWTFPCTVATLGEIKVSLLPLFCLMLVQFRS